MSAKAALLLPGVGWAGYLGGLIQIYATAGVVGSGIVVGWCFGREYADRTVVSLYASATPRTAVAGPSWCSSPSGPPRSASAWCSPPADRDRLRPRASRRGDGRSSARLAALAVLSGLLALPVARPPASGAAISLPSVA